MINTSTDEVNLEEVKEYVLKKLEKNHIAVLASCGSDMRVSARSMSIVHDGLTIWFQSDSRYLKAAQIRENPNVAIVIENIQIEGVARNVGHSSLESSRWFCEEFKRVHPGSYEAYTLTEHEQIYTVEPHLITLWRYSEGGAYRDFLNLKENSVLREPCVVNKITQ